MLDTEEICQYTKKLFVLYILSNIDNKKDAEYLKSLFETIHQSSDMKESLSLYKDYEENHGHFFDFVVIDSEHSIDIYKDIQKINPQQKIIILVESSEEIFPFIAAGASCFATKPLEISSFGKTVYTIARDIYDYKSLLESNLVLTDALQNKSDFLATMSHEIRTPMNAILGFSHILMNESALPDHQLDYLYKINNSSKMLLGIINDILDYSKIEAGKLQLENISFDINMILDYVADMVGLQAKEKGIELVFEINQNVNSHFIGDPLRISQVILNLMSNAVKFTDKGSVTLKVHTVDTKDTKTNIQFEVTDTGIGMSSKQVDMLFNSYSQAENSTSRKYGGTGLGLAISKQLVELMDGHIWVKSEYGHSSTFFVLITLGLNGLNDRRAYHLPYKELMKKRLLIIDSYEKSSQALAHMLGYFHMPVQCTSSFTKARDLLNTKKFDIVFIEEKMYAICDIKKLKKNNSAKIILLEERMYNTTSIDTKNKSKVDTYLKKPFNQQMVFDSIVRIYGDEKNAIDITKAEYTKDDLKALGHKKILIAEDHTINQRVIQGILRDVGFELVFVDDGEKAVQTLQSSEKFDLVFMDIHMPVMNGYEATKKIRQKNYFDSIPIIAMTGDVSPEDIQRVKDYGMQAHLAKPINAISLYELLIKYLKDESV